MTDLGIIVSAIPPTLFALAAWERSRASAKKVGVVSRKERKRLEHSEHRRRATDNDLSVITMVEILHADIIDLRDEVQEGTREVRERLQYHISQNHRGGR